VGRADAGAPLRILSREEKTVYARAKTRGS